MSCGSRVISFILLPTWKCVTDRQTNKQTDSSGYRVATATKNENFYYNSNLDICSVSYGIYARPMRFLAVELKKIQISFNVKFLIFAGFAANS